VAATINAISEASRILAENGTMLLWQSFNVLRRPILDAIEDSGLEIEIECFWNKKKYQPQDFTQVYHPQLERLLVIKRRGERLVNYSPTLWRGNILEFAPIQHRASSFGMTH
jgi:hypothetical protein